MNGAGWPAFARSDPHLDVAGPDHVLDLVECVLHVWFEIRSRIHVRPLERVARVDRQQGLGVHILAPEQEFVEAKAVGRAIPPRRHVSRAIRERPNRLLPFEPIGDLIPLEVVASGETQELRLHVDHHLHDVRTEAVRLILERRREQRHQTEPDRAGAIDRQDVACLRGGRHLVGLQRQFVPLPGRRQPGDGLRRVDRPAVVALDRDRDWCGESGRGLGVERRTVARVGLNWNAPIALVGDAGHVTGRGLGHVQPQTRPDGRVERLLWIERHRRGRTVGLDERPMRGCGSIVEERAVADEFSVQAAIVRMVDLLRHQPVEERADLARRRCGVDRDAWGPRRGLRSHRARARTVTAI